MRTRLPATGFVALVAACGLLNGLAGLLMAIGVAVALRFGASTRDLLRAAIVCLVLAAAQVVLVGLPDASTISAAFVPRRLFAHHLVFGSIVLLLVGVVLEERATQDTTTDAL